MFPWQSKPSTKQRAPVSKAPPLAEARHHARRLVRLARLRRSVANRVKTGAQERCQVNHFPKSPSSLFLLCFRRVGRVLVSQLTGPSMVRFFCLLAKRTHLSPSSGLGRVLCAGLAKRNYFSPGSVARTELPNEFLVSALNELFCLQAEQKLIGGLGRVLWTILAKRICLPDSQLDAFSSGSMGRPC